jgi:hypothetical protein
VQYCEREDFRRSLPAEVQEELAALDARFEAQVHRLLQEGIDEGHPPAEADSGTGLRALAALQGAARMIWGGCLERETEPGQYVEEITNFILAGMLYQEWLAEEGLDSEQATQRAERGVAGGGSRAGDGTGRARLKPVNEVRRTVLRQNRVGAFVFKRV